MKATFYKEILFPILSYLEKHKEQNAFCIDDVFYTYADFGQAISRIRAELAAKQLAPSNVGLVINDDLETYASIIALWLEGHAYVPLHPKWPEERCRDIVGQVGIDVVLDSQGQSFYSCGIGINTSDLANNPYDAIGMPLDVSEDNLAYILFTSGSTGKPKGVQLSRANLASFMDSFWKTGINLTDEDRCLQCFDLTFDVSVQSYLVALTRGACVYTVPYEQKKYLYVASLIDEHKLTFGAMAPSMLRYMKPYFSEIDASSLRYCILTAEACPLNMLEELYRFAPNVTLYDFYGPTECTIYATYYELHRGAENKSLNGIVSIGKTLSNVCGIIIDENGIELPDVEKGELCLSGEQLTSGYWNNAEKNASSFFTKVVNGKEQRFYHTGDLCYRDGEGDIMYSGRIDQQAKIQGFRVELGEIEFHARTFLKGVNVVCMAFENEYEVTEIAMFVESDAYDSKELLGYLRSKMPSYMIPSKMISVRTFPLNSSDKIDRQALKKLL